MGIICACRVMHACYGAPPTVLFCTSLHFNPVLAAGCWVASCTTYAVSRTSRTSVRCTESFSSLLPLPLPCRSHDVSPVEVEGAVFWLHRVRFVLAYVSLSAMCRVCYFTFLWYCLSLWLDSGTLAGPPHYLVQTYLGRVWRAVELGGASERWCASNSNSNNNSDMLHAVDRVAFRPDCSTGDLECYCCFHEPIGASILLPLVPQSKCNAYGVRTIITEQSSSPL